MKTILRNCNLIPELTEGFDKSKGDVIINGKYIEKITPVKEIYEGNFKEIDLMGKTLMPGLIELHTHLILDNSDYDGNLLYDNNKLLIEAYSFAREYIRQGYTTVRDVGSRGNVIVAIRDAILEGKIEGPRIVSSGQIISPTETGNESFGKMYKEADGCYEMRKACRYQFKEGNDFIKVMGTGAFLNNAGNPGMRIIEQEELEECVKVADMKKSYVSVHCHSDEGIRCAIASGVRTIEHGSFIEEDTAELLLKTPGVFLVPTGAIGMECLSDDNNNVSEDVLNKSKKFEKKEKEAINMAYKKGLKLGFGSDIDKEAFIRIPGYEFIARKEFYNFENIDILKQATINSAEILGMEDEIGTIKEGKKADIIVIDGDPVKDIYVMGNGLEHVFIGGERIYVEKKK